ncbi:hypothetical protein BEE62_10510 [Marinobacter nauticus]|jgi:hypothetical protein|uniref:Uncharacterized protein n=2 Tax=Marinobacteraceae TaxID=2887365 RepID=A0A1M2UYS4_MARNT|nr:hypothetical protein BEE62_10510 [Marinobacter nauticus]
MAQVGNSLAKGAFLGIHCSTAGFHVTHPVASAPTIGRDGKAPVLSILLGFRNLALILIH